MTGGLGGRVYRLATALLEPAAGAYLRRRLTAGKEDPGRLGERHGRPGLPRPAGPLVWLHGASVGEALAVLPLAGQLAGRGLAVLFTTGTVNAAAVLRPRLPPGAFHQFAPLDLPGAAASFVRHWRPHCALFAESELWPNLVFALRERDVPLALVNARMSPRSFRRWQRLPRFIGDLLRETALCLAQTEADAERLRTLGAPRASTTGNLKFDAEPPKADPRAVARLRAAIGDRPVWMAASAHAAEESLLLEAAAAVRAHRPDALLILVPRQPGRGGPVAAAAEAAGLPARRHAAGALPDADTAVLVGDTVGESGLFLALSPVVFVGKSLAGGGGQNPIEPAKLGRAILHGPHVGNFEAVYDLLDRAGGSRCVTTAPGLAPAVTALLDDPAQARAMGMAGARAVAAEAGATARTLAALAPLLPRVPA